MPLHWKNAFIFQEDDFRRQGYIAKEKGIYRWMIKSILILTATNCHNPTNNPKQVKTIVVGVVLVSVRKPQHTTPHHTTPGMITIRADFWYATFI